jgi:DNA polymerase
MGAEPADASPWVPDRAGLPGLRRAAADCRGCELWERGTQTVFGEGPSSARILLVGEQPGDEEDRQGRPFVGPAGRLLDRALLEAGIDRDDAYVTNAVKHFRWEGQRGKKRIHRKPGLAHVRACEPWLRAELRVVRPEVVVLMGATAARSLLGPAFRVTEHRGRFVETELEAIVTATVHPSSILRARDDVLRRSETEAFVRDLRVAAGALA